MWIIRSRHRRFKGDPGAWAFNSYDPMVHVRRLLGISIVFAFRRQVPLFSVVMQGTMPLKGGLGWDPDC